MDYYIGILGRALDIARSYKALWAFGFASALSSGISRVVTQWSYAPPGGLPRFSIGMILFWVLLWLISAFVSYLSTGALIGMVGEVEETGTTSILNGFQVGISRLLPLIGISLLLFIPFFFFFFVIWTLAVALAQALGPAARVFWGLLCIAGGAIMSLLWQFPNRICVIELKGAGEALGAGFHTLRQNLGRAVVMGLLLSVAGLGGWIVVAFTDSLCGLKGLSRIYLPEGPWQLPLPTLASGPIPAAIALVIGAVVNGLVGVFTSTAWTVMYLRLPGEREGGDAGPFEVS